MTMKFRMERHPANPLLIPDRSSPWESVNVFNPSVIHHNGLFHMHYRAEGEDWISRIGYAVSADGISWNRLREPVLVPLDELENRGVQDPRVTEIEGVFYMAYTAWMCRDGVHGCYPMIARSTNLVTWERIGPIVTNALEYNKDHVLFPRRIKGRYVAFHRPHPNVCIAQSDDLVTWKREDMATVFGPGSETGWDAMKVGMNGVPIETKHGWLCFYHGVNRDSHYHTNAILLDLDDPTKVIRRPEGPILAPEEVWEIRGDVPNVVFSNANILVGDTVYVYYGGGDHVIALATCKLDAILDYVLNG